MANKVYLGTGVEAFNRGYSDGYQKKEKDSQHSSSSCYMRGYSVGRDDRALDDRDLESGTFDLLTKEEREYLYGDESDRI